ncbi:hypothetical protein [Arthrobacter sp. A2-55]|uniref:hypothetical protein n=1 Tax=Arthrobacter sp. A2-55 TaxID=2897337 RepID=UPI0021CD5D7A|nr:hypothetical protein [Arthrobacter sp. A2-55]MCU6480130.1 hypothetical protein [Arthrobacter sp. A2-55]
MTTSTSPRDLLANYRQEARANATQSGCPLDRSAFPGLGLEATGMIYLNGKSLVFQPMRGRREPLTPEKIAELVTTELFSTIVADRQTFGRMLVMADNMPSNDFKSLSRRLRIIQGLPGSMKLPVLTDSLASRYWLPEEMAENSVEDWADAFGVTGPTTAITVRALTELAMEGHRPEALKYDKTVTALEALEGRIMEQAAWPKISTDCYVYSMLESYSAKANGLRTIDPGLLEMHMIDGQVCKIVPMNLGAKTFTASVSAPFKLKEGRNVRLTDGSSLGTTSLDSLRYASGSLHAVFNQVGPRSRGYGLVQAAHAGTAPLFAAEEVFESRGSALQNKRWLGGPVERITGRTVPMDVVLAGAPTD